MTQTQMIIPDALADMFPQEELDPELEAYLEPGGDLGAYIRHPLVYSLMHHEVMNGYVNKQLRAKQAAADEAWENGEWSSYVFIHERPYRIGAFQEIEDELDDAAYWDLLGELWTDSENIRQNPDVWFDLLRSERGSREAIMNTAEYEALQAMPDTITVYQGHTGTRDDGWSWTTARHTAVWFAHRFAELEHDDPVVTEGTVSKADVIAYFTSRNESEILVPHELVRDVTSTTLPPRESNDR
jgi:hypothetical protein